MTAALLEIRDGVAVGPLHQPVPTIGRDNFFDDAAFDWPTLCGVTGYAYQREALAELGYTSECFECAVAALANSKPEPIPLPPYRAKTRREYKRDRMRRERGTVERPPRACVSCGTVFTPSIYGPRNPRRFCSAACRKRAWRRAA